MAYLLIIKEILEQYGELTAEQIALFIEKERGYKINRSNLRAKLYKYYSKGYFERKIIKRPYGREYIYYLPQSNGHSFNTQQNNKNNIDGGDYATNINSN